MTKPHKHAKAIKAWADGAEIQMLQMRSDFAPKWEDVDIPGWYDDIEYRIKPEPAAPVVEQRRLSISTSDGKWFTSDLILTCSDGKIIKAEVVE